MRKQGQGDLKQKRLLREEGVLFDSSGRIDLENHGWQMSHDVLDGETLESGD